MKWIRVVSLALLCLVLLVFSTGCPKSETQQQDTTDQGTTLPLKASVQWVDTDPSDPHGCEVLVTNDSGFAWYGFKVVITDNSGVVYTNPYLHQDLSFADGRQIALYDGDLVNGNGQYINLRTAWIDSYTVSMSARTSPTGKYETITAIANSYPPVISGVASTNITTSGTTISWTTNEAATSQVEYGTTVSYGSSSVLDSSLVATHIVNLTGLTAGSAYHYRVKSKDASGNEASSDDKTFSSVQPAPAIVILSHSSYLDSIGCYHVVGEVRNDSSNKLKYVEITATFYNSAGTVVGTDFTYTSIDTLLPNQKSPFELIETDAAISAQVDHYAVAFSDSNITGADSYRAFTILSHSSSTDSLGYYHVVGEVENTGTQAVTYVNVVGTFYDTTGKVVAAHFTYTSPHDLAAGQTAPFEIIVLSDTQSAKISSYELQVQSQS
jgi:hypothetical protein